MDDLQQTITIRLKPHLQEYLRCKLGQESLTAKRTFIGPLLRPFLQIRPQKVPPVMATGEEYITIEIPTYMRFEVRRGSAYMSERNQAEFERILNAHFWDYFFSYMDDKVRYFASETTRKGAIKRCILQFCSDNNISYNHINYEMMKKAYYRRRKESPKKEKKFANNLSLGCPLCFLI